MTTATRTVGTLVIAAAGGALAGGLAGRLVVGHLSLPVSSVADTVVRLFALAGLLTAGAIYAAATRH